MSARVEPGRMADGYEPPSAALTPAASPLLTDAEHRAMGLTTELWNLLCEIVGNGPSRAGDLRELAHDVHVIQERILAQAAGRAYPDRYRLLGGVVIERIEGRP